MLVFKILGVIFVVIVMLGVYAILKTDFSK